MPKIDLRKAVQNVQDYIVEFNDILENNLEGAMVEETELSEDEKYWLITIGFNRKIDPREQYVSALMGGILAKAEKPATMRRDYKIFKVDSSTGEVVSMKIYKL
ncbi:hypothetical protein [Pleurocapsa sp. FMAR1]|uniref:hypothetical protein n=1 Tax=Pleurocapsa sp. FMAR1 TaxID=3040204 RepID=UPI0029C902A9|nr:hypothetical protein [Pleurocapsa sp. FMAR1]